MKTKIALLIVLLSLTVLSFGQQDNQNWSDNDDRQSTLELSLIDTNYKSLTKQQDLAGQNLYVNTDFEKTDTSGKSIIFWQTINKDTEFMLDSTNKSSGNYSLFFKHKHELDSSGQTFSMKLPKSLNKDLRTINISIKIRESSDKYPQAGLWCKIKKSKKLLGFASTYKGQLAFPMDITESIISDNTPIMLWAWTSYSIDITVKEDPDEIVIGGFAIGSAWFDDIQISINGNLINNLVIPLKID
jgi:hypothetical protein